MLAVLAAVALLAGACRTGGDGDRAEGPPPPPPSRGRWTEAFLPRVLVVAEEIAIEGPPALRDHLVVPQDAASTTSTTRATDRGLLQEITARQGLRAEIRAHLDNWELVATRRLRVLERPGETDVVLVARGNALIHPLEPAARGEPSERMRAPELTVRGRLDGSSAASIEAKRGPGPGSEE